MGSVSRTNWAPTSCHISEHAKMDKKKEAKALRQIGTRLPRWDEILLVIHKGSVSVCRGPLSEENGGV